MKYENTLGISEIVSRVKTKLGMVLRFLLAYSLLVLIWLNSRRKGENGGKCFYCYLEVSSESWELCRTFPLGGGGGRGEA